MAHFVRMHVSCTAPMMENLLQPFWFKPERRLTDHCACAQADKIVIWCLRGSYQEDPDNYLQSFGHRAEVFDPCGERSIDSKLVPSFDLEFEISLDQEAVDIRVESTTRLTASVPFIP